jgi:hypothetical protein
MLSLGRATHSGRRDQMTFFIERRPIEQSLRFHMAVNLKTAASLDVSLPDAFVARANEVRE